MIIRPATPADYDVLAVLWYDSWESVGISNEADLSREAVIARFHVDVARWTLFAAEAPEGLIGLLALLPEENRIDQIFVAPHVKGKGVGRALLNLAKQVMPTGIVLFTQGENQRARSFYEREGFRLTEQADNPEQRRTRCTYEWSPAPQG